MIHFALMLLLLAGTVYAFPENIRHGYASCAACHVAPSGGGLLTNYGRGQDGLEEQKVLIGGDFRFANIDGRRRFLMQADVNAGAQYGPVTAVVGGDALRVKERGYVLANYGGGYVRIGRFSPAFGLNQPDHTVTSRRLVGLGGGKDYDGGEIFFVSDYGEVSVGRYQTFGTVGRASAFIANHISVGGSFKHSDEGYTSGAHLLAGFGRYYTMADYTRVGGGDSGFYSLVGAALFQSLHVRALYEGLQTHTYGLQLQWLFPHWEVITQVKYLYEPSFLGMLHYYL